MGRAILGNTRFSGLPGDRIGARGEGGEGRRPRNGARGGKQNELRVTRPGPRPSPARRGGGRGGEGDFALAAG